MEFSSSSADNVEDTLYIPPPPQESSGTYCFLNAESKSFLAQVIIFTVSHWEQLVFYNGG